VNTRAPAGLKELSRDQDRVLESALEWAETGRRPYLTVGGYAGTGKTTLLGILRNELEHRRPGLKVALASYTGKASRVLESKLRDAYARFPQDYTGTLHGLIYQRRVEEDGKIVGWHRRPSLDCDLVIVDEASMVDETIWKDLLSFGKRVLAVGDHGQLPPVNGDFRLMAEPDLTLTRIHRQAARNPILRLSERVRRTGRLPKEADGAAVRLMDRAGDEAGEFLEGLFRGPLEDTLILCGSNRTRTELNRRVRLARGIESPDPVVGDRVICLRNNWAARPYPVCNGMLGTLAEVEPAVGKEPPCFEAVVLMDDEPEPYEGYLDRLGFLRPAGAPLPHRRGNDAPDLFDFGYALTVHKAQGSEAERVVLFVERFWTGDVWRRWLYTAVTRARERLVVIDGGASPLSD
jgi:exodeoxyribonuclease-5